MRIVHISYSDSSGGASYIARELQGMDVAAGMQSYLLVADKSCSAEGVLQFAGYRRRRRIANALVQRVLVPLFARNKTITNSLSCLPTDAVDQINELKPDLVHIHWPNGELFSLSQISAIQASIVWTLHDNWVCNALAHHSVRTFDDCWDEDYRHSSVLKFFYLNYKLPQLAKHHSMTFVAPSQWSAMQYKSSPLAKCFPVEVIPNGIDREIFALEEISQEKTGASDSEFNVAFGAFSSSAAKGGALFSSVVKVFGDANFFSIGGGVIEGVQHLGFLSRERLAEKLLNIDCLLLPSHVESFGLLACEAISAGCPVICFAGTGCDEFVVNGVNGYLVEYSEDPINDFVACLNELRALALDRKRVSESVKEYTLSNMWLGYQELYDRVYSNG